MITLFASSFVDHVVLINHLPELTQIRVRRFKEISFISLVNTKLFVCDVRRFLQASMVMLFQVPKLR